MPELERTADLKVEPDVAFGYLSDPKNLTSYVSTMVMSEPEAGGDLRVAADVEGRHEEGEASFRPDPAARKIEWGSKANAAYHGWLEVSEHSGGSSVTVRISTDRTEEGDRIERALDETI